MKNNISRILITFTFLMLGVIVSNAAIISSKSEIANEDYKEESNYINAQIKIPKVNIKDEKLQNYINETIKNKVLNYKNDIERESLFSFHNDNKNYKKVTLQGYYEIKYNKNDFVSILMSYTDSTDDKKIHRESFNIDLNTGRFLELNDVFDEKENYMNIVTSTLQEKLKNIKDLNTDIYLTEDLKFYLDDIGVNIFFNAYDLWNEESLEVKISYDKFKYSILDLRLKPLTTYIYSENIREINDYYISDINIPKIIDIKDEEFKNKLNKFFENDLKEFNNEAKESAKIAYDESKDDDYGFTPHSSDVFYDIMKNEDGILSIVATYYQYTGGAHGNWSRVGYNIDIENKKIIEIKDLFKEGFDYKTVISDDIKTQIEALNKKYEEEMKKEGETVENLYFGFEGITDESEFYLKGNDLIIFFSPYEIAPYSEGSPEFKIPLEKLKNNLRNEA